MPQMVQWITTGVVAQGKIRHAGITQARAIVRNKAGKRVEVGLPYLLRRLGGGYIFGTMIQGGLDETKMPLAALRNYRAIFGAKATPALMIYDRGGGVKSPRDQLAKDGGTQVGVQPTKANSLGALPRPSGRWGGARVARPKGSLAP